MDATDDVNVSLVVSYAATGSDADVLPTASHATISWSEHDVSRASKFSDKLADGIVTWWATS